MIKWWKARSTQEKWMIALIAMLLLGIAVRWSFIKSELSGELQRRFSVPTEQTDSLPK
jgi:hypothetical protein